MLVYDVAIDTSKQCGLKVISLKILVLNILEVKSYEI